MNHSINLLLIIFGCGIIGGLINYLRLSIDYQAHKNSILKSILMGLGASGLVPLFLKMISSDLLMTSEANPIDYFTIGGFCLVTSIFSNKFIDSIGDKVMNKLEKVSKEVKDVKTELEDVTTERDYMDKTNILQGVRSLNSNDLAILTSINDSKYTYRALGGITKDSNLTRDETQQRLTELENKEMVQKSLRKNNQYKWRITEKGQEIVAEYYEDESSSSAVNS